MRPRPQIRPHQETEREADLQQLKAKLQRGALQAQRGELLDEGEVFKELRQLIAERKGIRKKATRVKRSSGLTLKEDQHYTLEGDTTANMAAGC